jgi:hypothetical protein
MDPVSIIVDPLTARLAEDAREGSIIATVRRSDGSPAAGLSVGIVVPARSAPGLRCIDHTTGLFRADGENVVLGRDLRSADRGSVKGALAFDNDELVFFEVVIGAADEDIGPVTEVAREGAQARAKLVVIVDRAGREIAGSVERLLQGVEDTGRGTEVSQETRAVRAAAEPLGRAIAKLRAKAAALDPDAEFSPTVLVPDEAGLVDGCIEPGIREAVLTALALARAGALPPEERLRELMRKDQARRDAEQAHCEAERKAQRGETVFSEVGPSRRPGRPRDKRDRVSGELERFYGGDLTRLESLWAESKGAQAKLLGLGKNDVRTLARAREELAVKVALGL